MSIAFILTDTVERFRQGDKAAFEELHGLYADLLVRWLSRQCSGSVSADDVAQIAWVSAWTKRELFQGGNFRAWLFRIAINEKNSAGRQSRKNTHVDFQEDETVLGKKALQSFREPIEIERKQHYLAVMKECLESVGGDFVAVLRMQVNEQLTPVEIAQRLAITNISTIYTRANRGRAAIRECMKQKLE